MGDVHGTVSANSFTFLFLFWNILVRHVLQLFLFFVSP